MDEKLELIEEIKTLIDTNSNSITQINMKYIEYFELDELKSIRDDLLGKKNNSQQESNDFLDEIFNKCS
ncbi:MAG TPA: hypothetical protein ENK66_08060 [Arcobacter sp.]|jgi:hypothetical protein|nr:hypothetical protein [Arcobacter sp.]